jgi:hypothetical protein
MKLAAALLVGAILVTGCSKKEEPSAKPPQPKAVSNSCTGNSGKVVRVNEAPAGAELHGNNIPCVLDYLATFDKNTIDGSAPIEAMAKDLCPSITRLSLTVHAEFKGGKSLQDELAAIREINNNAISLAGMTKVTQYVWNNRELDAETLRKDLEKQCLQSPRAFYLIHPDEIRQYRVVDGPISPKEEIELKVQAIYEDTLAAAREKTSQSSANFENEVRNCITVATRDKAAVKNISSLEIEAACRTVLK